MKEHSYGIAPYLMISGHYFVLLNKTSRTSYYNFFKGKIEPNESKEDCAIREFFEETGIKVDRADLGLYIEQKNPKKDIGVYLLNFSKYHSIPFTFERKEIFSAIWVNTSNIIEVSKNQKSIFEHIMDHFK